MGHKSVIGGNMGTDTSAIDLDINTAHKSNIEFWNTIGSDVLGVTALPHYGSFISEDKLHLFGDVQNKSLLEIGCGNGHSLKYMSDKGASELWGMDLSPTQIERAKEYLTSYGINAKLLCSSMESECEIPKGYFDFVYAIYAIGWTTDLNKTISQICSYLKTGGTFIFSWSHPIHKCVSQENGMLLFNNSYFDESWYSVPMANKKIMLSNRKLSTYINTLAQNGFLVEQLIEENDEELFSDNCISHFQKKAKMLPVTFVIKARKL
ncbi:MAG: class I SAM-dependent methyltransferase [Clostridiaceae bacterium]|nr:class I SAM-dependent methyltransferase [Clostridiaceae bacterium]